MARKKTTIELELEVAQVERELVAVKREFRRARNRSRILKHERNLYRSVLKAIEWEAKQPGAGLPSWLSPYLMAGGGLLGMVGIMRALFRKKPTNAPVPAPILPEPRVSARSRKESIMDTERAP